MRILTSIFPLRKLRSVKNLKVSILVRIAAVNTLLTALFLLVPLEIWLRFYHPSKGISWISSDYHRTIEEASHSASTTEELVLVVGDSFAAHQKDQGGNMFDLIYGCSSGHQCNYKYFNLSIPGTNTSDYWSSLNYVLNRRSPNSPTRVIMLIYYGNDFHISDKERAECNKIYPLRNPATTKTLMSRLSSASLSLRYLYRIMKLQLSLGKNDSVNLKARADYLRNRVSSWQKGSYEPTLARVPTSIMYQIKNDVLNPWEVALAMANPYYYSELYNLSASWSIQALECTKTSIAINLENLRDKHPRVQFTLLGLPDKQYWNPQTSRTSISQYTQMGFLQSQPDTRAYTSIPIQLTDLASRQNFKFLHLPLILGNDTTDISNYFYVYDMHLNRHGNIELSKALRPHLD